MENSDDAEPFTGCLDALEEDAALALSSESATPPGTKRPRISAAIARQVLTESGHRCAVCGAESPLERAHIIPWSKVRRHNPENLICLCANCHQRADLENWGERTLRFYKENPWINRSRTKCESPPVQVRLTIDMAVADFDEKAQRLLRHAMAGFLEISPDAIKVLKIEEGSVKVTLELPAKAAQKLMSEYHTVAPSLAERFQPFKLLGIEEDHIVAQEDRAKQPSREETSIASVKVDSFTRAKLAVYLKKPEDSRRHEIDETQEDRGSNAVATEVKRIRIRQVRSVIGSRREHREILRGLGIRKIRQEVERPDTPEVRAMIEKIRSLIEVSEDN